MEARIHAEEADKRERAAEIRRDARLKKIKYMTDMDDNIEVSSCRTKYSPLADGSWYMAIFMG